MIQGLPQMTALRCHLQKERKEGAQRRSAKKERNMVNLCLPLVQNYANPFFTTGQKKQSYLLSNVSVLLWVDRRELECLAVCLPRWLASASFEFIFITLLNAGKPLPASELSDISTTFHLTLNLMVD